MGRFLQEYRRCPLVQGSEKPRRMKKIAYQQNGLILQEDNRIAKVQGSIQCRPMEKATKNQPTTKNRSFRKIIETHWDQWKANNKMEKILQEGRVQWDQSIFGAETSD